MANGKGSNFSAIAQVLALTRAEMHRLNNPVDCASDNPQGFLLGLQSKVFRSMLDLNSKYLRGEL